MCRRDLADQEAWRSSIRAEARADKLKVRTYATESWVFAFLIDYELSEEQKRENEEKLREVFSSMWPPSDRE